MALYTPPASAQLGHHAVRWFVRAAAGELHFETPFEVLAAPIDVPQPGYCMLQDLRDEGFLPDAVSDARLVRTIALASRTIERITGRPPGCVDRTGELRTWASAAGYPARSVCQDGPPGAASMDFFCFRTQRDPSMTVRATCSLV